MKSIKTDTSADNIFDFVPRRLIEWEKDDQGRVYLLKEKSKKKIMKKIIDFFHKSQFFRIHLDELGTRAWLLADGKRSVLQITREMKKELGDKIVQGEKRVSQFFILMKRHNFISFN